MNSPFTFLPIPIPVENPHSKAKNYIPSRDGEKELYRQITLAVQSTNDEKAAETVH